MYSINTYIANYDQTINDHPLEKCVQYISDGYREVDSIFGGCLPIINVNSLLC